MINEGYNMKVLVTGATGFIGNYVVKELLKYEHKIIATSIEHKNQLQFSWIEKVDYIQADLNEDKKDWFAFFNEPDQIIHLAWEGLPNYNELFHIERNLPRNCCFVKNIIENGLKKVVVIGTCFEYGMQSGALNETMATMPDNPYAIAKDTLRKFLEQLQKKINFELKWVRLFYMYGKGQSPNAILSQLDRTLQNGETSFNMSGGEQLRDYLPVEKVAEYIVKIAMQNKVYGIINCCSGTPVSIRKLLENHLERKKRSIHLNLGYYPYPDYEPMAFWGDSSKLNGIIKRKR